MVTPYVLEKFGDLSATKGIVIGYQDNQYTNMAAAQLLFGGIVPEGKLPVTASEEFPAGTGLTYPEKIRLTHVIPEEIGIDTEKLYRISQICNNGIHMKAFPGCQVVAIKDGNVFYNEAFGHHTYDKKKKSKDQ